MPKLTPTEAQEEAIQSIMNEPTHAALVASTTGAGKTLIAVEAFKRLDVNTVLVIIPLNTIDSWKATFANQWPDFPVYTVTAKKPEDFSRLQKGERGAYLIGREFFKIAATDLWHKKPYVVNGKAVEVDDKDRPPKRAKRWDYKSVNRHLDAVAADEVHFAQNRDSEAFKVLRTIRPKRLKIGMSATPGGNKFAGIWAVCRWLWPTTMHEDGTPVVDKSKWRWAATWARVEFDPFAGKKITDEKVPGAFVASLPCYIRDEPPKKPYKRFKVQLDATPEQRRQIAQMEEKSVVWLDEHPLVADLPIVQKIRLRQMTLGEVCFNGDDEIDFDIDCKSAKLDACEKIIERHPGEKILFWTDSRKFAQVAAKRLSKPGRLAAAWTGDENAKKRADLKGRFTDPDSDLRFLVVSIAAMAEGVDGMQRVCHTEVWLNRSFNGVHNEQAEGRLNRRGQAADEVVGYFLEMRNTADTEDFARDAKSILTRRNELHRTS